MKVVDFLLITKIKKTLVKFNQYDLFELQCGKIHIQNETGS